MDEGAGKPRQDEIKMEQRGETSPKEETKGLSGGDQVTKDGTKEEQPVEKVAESGKESLPEDDKAMGDTAPAEQPDQSQDEPQEKAQKASQSSPAHRHTPAPTTPTPRQLRKAQRIHHRAHQKEEAAQRKAQRLLWQEEQAAQIREARSRKPDIRGRAAARIYRQRKRQGKQLGTPDLRKAGFPQKRRPLRQVGMVFLCLFLLAGSAAFYVLDVPSWQRLDIRKITAAPQTGRMFDNQGQLIATIRGSQNRVVIPLEQIPQQIRDVFIAAEDLRFYQHRGVDLVRLFGALAANIREGGYAQGGSTITMQLIRQSHLSTKKTIARKASAISSALRVMVFFVLRWL